MDFTIDSRSCFVHCSFQVQKKQWTKQELGLMSMTAIKARLIGFTTPHFWFCDRWCSCSVQFYSKTSKVLAHWKGPPRFSWRPPKTLEFSKETLDALPHRNKNRKVLRAEKLLSKCGPKEMRALSLYGRFFKNWSSVFEGFGA